MTDPRTHLFNQPQPDPGPPTNAMGERVIAEKRDIPSMCVFCGLPVDRDRLEHWKSMLRPHCPRCATFYYEPGNALKLTPEQARAKSLAWDERHKDDPR